ncbi:hypothetical protein RI367_004868 [Sorochytrium milnesiophthora]
MIQQPAHHPPRSPRNKLLPPLPKSQSDTNVSDREHVHGLPPRPPTPTNATTEEWKEAARLSAVRDKPPEPDTPYTRLKLGQNGVIKGLQTQCDQLKLTISDLRRELEISQKLIEKLNFEKKHLLLELQDRAEAISKFARTAQEHEANVKIRYRVCVQNIKVAQSNTGDRDEIEALLKHEIVLRQSLEQEAVELKRTIKTLQTTCREHEQSVLEHEKVIQKQAEVIGSHGHDVSSLYKQISALEFDRDELKVTVIKMERKSATFAGIEEQLRAEIAVLQKSETGLREENGQLKQQMINLVKSTEELAKSHDSLKIIVEERKGQIDQLTGEIEESRRLYAIVTQEKKKLQTELTAVQKEKTQLLERNKNLDNILAKKDRDVSELLSKVNETIKEYEAKLEKKEEQMFAMSERMAEESAAQRMAAENADQEVIKEIEQKYKVKEQQCMSEIEHLKNTISQRDTTILENANKITDLEARQFGPRMERLQAIETDFKNRIEEYLLAEESLETGLLCPKCLKFMVRPYTLSPCGHTYCKACVELLRSQNYETLCCQECPDTTITAMFSNEQLDSVSEKFRERKSLMISMLGWITKLKEYLPADA